jgi:hypothetical protein
VTGVLDHFDFSTISSPQTAGTAFSVTITAVDLNGNTVTSYTGINALTASTGTISPTSTLAFTAGVWTGSVTLTSAGAGRSIGTTGSTKSGTSGTFTVNPGVLHHFVFANIGNQLRNTIFSITITAVDANGNTVTSYTGTPTLACLVSGTNRITPTNIGPFVAGTKTGSVQVTRIGTGLTITATGGSATGTSNTFNVT